MRRISIALAFCSAVATLSLSPAAALASVAPPPASEQCGGVVASVTRVDSTHLKASFRLECDSTAHPAGFEVAGIVSRSGYTKEPHAYECGRAQSCTETFTFTDLPGSQKYTFFFDPDSYLTFGVNGGVRQCLGGSHATMSCQRYTASY